MNGKSGILLISPDSIGAEIAGPGIRYWEMAKVISRDFKVTLLVPGDQNLPNADFLVERLNRSNLRKQLAKRDVVILQGLILDKHPSIKKSGKHLVIDIYNTAMLENLENEFHLERWEQNNHFTSVLNGIKKQLSTGDFFICASEKQRDFWLGMLSAMGRLNPHNYQMDKSFRKIIDVVPFGLPSEKPVHSKKVLKGINKGIHEDDFVVLWGGGIWNWLDPLTPIKAMKTIRETHPKIKLFFMGSRLLDKKKPEYLYGMHDRAYELARELQVLNKNVFFNDAWVPYDLRANYLLEADAGLSCHFEYIETEFSFRTRLLDYIWANLPIITSNGDAMSETVEKEKLGITIEPNDCDALVKAIIKLFEAKDFFNMCAENCNKIARIFRWDEAVKPLMLYCHKPYFALDKDASRKITLSNKFKYNIIKAYKFYRREGFRGLLKRVQDFLLEKLCMM